MCTGKPWPGTKLLISNGKEILAEATTGADGIFQQTFGQLREAVDVRVLAVADGHTASNVVDLKGMSVAQGLSDKGYIYTDRPLYRAGQRVFVRGCIWQAANDRYVIEKGKHYGLEVFGPRNRLVWQEDVALSPFGSFHTDFPLPTTSPQGEYRLVVRAADRYYHGTFQVREYTNEPVRLIFKSDRWVHYRGETIQGTIRAEYNYGAPLAGCELKYQLADTGSESPAPIAWAIRCLAKGICLFRTIRIAFVCGF